MRQFIFSCFPQFYIVDDERKQGPILSLFDNEELKSYSVREKKKKDMQKKNKKEENDKEIKSIESKIEELEKELKTEKKEENNV